MNKKRLKQEYDKLIAEIESAKMFDGRNKGVDVYQCKDCGFVYFTRYKDKGVTPFTLKCRNCGHSNAFHEKTISEECAEREGFIVHNWVRPTFEQLQKLDDGTIEHVLNGGLVLDDEIETMKAKCIKSDPLETLQVGKIYNLKEYPFNFTVMDGAKIVFGIFKDKFKEYFELIQQ